MKIRIAIAFARDDKGNMLWCASGANNLSDKDMMKNVSSTKRVPANIFELEVPENQIPEHLPVVSVVGQMEAEK